jgi:hypothetical protein
LLVVVLVAMMMMMMMMIITFAVSTGFRTTDRWPPRQTQKRGLNLHSPALAVFMCET